jgi:pimeloyl-ACP methyl ester carboxylesterase
MTTTSTLPDVGIELREGYAEVGDEVRLHYVEAGDGPLVVLLHGFPEFWFGWRLQIAPLAAAGFRVVAPDLRGYNLSSKPDGVAAYSAGKLAADVRDLIRERGGRPSTLQ